MDPIVVVILIGFLMPVAVVLALAKAASLRGPTARVLPRRPVDTLVTEAIPEPRDDDEQEVDAADYQADGDSAASSPPPSPPSSRG